MDKENRRDANGVNYYQYLVDLYCADSPSSVGSLALTLGVTRATIYNRIKSGSTPEQEAAMLYFAAHLAPMTLDEWRTANIPA